MKKIYSLVCASVFMLLGATACDDGSLSHDDVYIPEPVEETDEDDGISMEPTTDAVIRVQPGEGHQHQNIDGFGCSFGWMEAVYRCTQREQIMDDLYGKNGLRFNIYRGEVCSSSVDANGNVNFLENDNFQLAADSPELTRLAGESYNGEGGGKLKQYAQLWLINQLCKKNLKDIYYFFSVWSPPGIWKKNFDDPNMPLNSGSFNSAYSQEYADFLTGFVKTFKNKFGINVHGISGWNEPDQAMGGWAGCVWGYDQMADFVCDYLRPKLNEAGCTDTKVVYDELPWWTNAVTWMKNSLDYRPELAGANIIGAGHGYSTVEKNIIPMTAAEENNIPVWLTETCDDKTRDETWNDAMKWAENYQRYLTIARVNAIVWWAGARYCTSTGENLLQLDDWEISHSYYKVDRYYSIGQFSRYIRVILAV